MEPGGVAGGAVDPQEDGEQPAAGRQPVRGGHAGGLGGCHVDGDGAVGVGDQARGVAGDEVLVRPVGYRLDVAGGVRGDRPEPPGSAVIAGQRRVDGRAGGPGVRERPRPPDPSPPPGRSLQHAGDLALGRPPPAPGRRSIPGRPPTTRWPPTPRPAAAAVLGPSADVLARSWPDPCLDGPRRRSPACAKVSRELATWSMRLLCRPGAFDRVPGRVSSPRWG